MSSTRIHIPIRTYTQLLTECRPKSTDVPYGCYKYESDKNYLPGGLFHFVRDDAYVPTLHGLSADFLRDLKDVGVCAVESSIANRPFLNTPHLYEVELINTGHESLKQGDRFAVQLPNADDVAAQVEAAVDPGYDRSVNKGVWGGLLATRKVNCESGGGGDPVEEAIQAIKHVHEFDVFQLMSPYTPQSILSMMTLVANGSDHQSLVTSVLRHAAAAAVNEDFDSAVVSGVLEDKGVKSYLKNVIEHAMNIVESVQGFAAGQVVRACTGYNVSAIGTGKRFVAQLNVNRWLM